MKSRNMQELIQLENTESLYTRLCNDCAYCLILDKNRECEWDMFEPICKDKSDLYTPIEFDCFNFLER